MAYLDNAATTQKPQCVLDALTAFYAYSYANVHRGVYELSERATETYEQARKDILAFLDGTDDYELIFTRSTTEAINLFTAAWGQTHITKDDALLVSMMEHHSNLVPWMQLGRQKQARVVPIPLTPQGELDLNAYSQAMQQGPKAVSFTHTSNVLGTINPVEHLTRLAHEAGALVVVDAAQALSHGPVSIRKINCDALAFSGHKMYGPTGIGGLVIRRSLLHKMDPYMTGGEMIERVSFDRIRWADGVQKFEAGTPNAAGAIALAEATRFIHKLGWDTIQQQEQMLTQYMISALKQIPGLRIYGQADQRATPVSFTIEGLHPHDIAQIADTEGVALRSGHMCTQPLLDYFGLSALTRASSCVYNTTSDIDRLIHALEKTKRMFA